MLLVTSSIVHCIDRFWVISDQKESRYPFTQSFREYGTMSLLAEQAAVNNNNQ